MKAKAMAGASPAPADEDDATSETLDSASVVEVTRVQKRLRETMAERLGDEEREIKELEEKLAAKRQRVGVMKKDLDEMA